MMSRESGIVFRCLADYMPHHVVDVLSDDGTLLLITPWGTEVDGDLITRLRYECGGQ